MCLLDLYVWNQDLLNGPPTLFDKINRVIVFCLASDIRYRVISNTDFFWRAVRVNNSRPPNIPSVEREKDLCRVWYFSFFTKIFIAPTVTV